jgi:hypothetical protein
MPPRPASASAHPSHAAGAERELSAARLLSCNDTLVAAQHRRAPKPGDRDKCRLGPRP